MRRRIRRCRKSSASTFFPSRRNGSRSCARPASSSNNKRQGISMAELLVDNDGPIRILTMNRPEKRNALNMALSQALLDGLHEADRTDSVRALVLTGAGPGFCAGADLSEFAVLTADNAPLVQRHA